MKNDNHSKNISDDPKRSQIRSGNCRDQYHLSRDHHKQNQERLEFYSS